MAHFAQLVNNVVTYVLVVDNAVAYGDFPESEQRGVAHLRSMGFDGEWKQVSYNGTIRGRLPAPGHTYDPETDEFYPPKLFESWTWSGSDWVAPVAPPDDGNYYGWDEAAGGWVIIEPVEPSAN